jgi:LPPG:FO 2-phospho-L-lactate transferase
MAMEDEPVELDRHRSSAGKMASELRRHAIRDSEADQQALRLQHHELEAQLLAETSRTWPEVAAKAQYLIRHHDVAATDFRFAGASTARSSPAALAALADAERVVIAPSNPLVSIAPVLAVPGLRAAVEARREDTVAVSPIIAGTTVKGPADRLLTELGHDASVVGVARLYAPLAARLVIDEADADLADAVTAEGTLAVVAPTLMTGPPEAAALARVVLS